MPGFQVRDSFGFRLKLPTPALLSKHGLHRGGIQSIFTEYFVRASHYSDLVTFFQEISAEFIGIGIVFTENRIMG
jgi:hypothetical protein